MKLRKATMEDAAFLLEIKNDPTMRQFAVVTHEEITWNNHVNWLTDHVGEMLIIEENKERAGMFRIADDLEVSINIHPKFRGQSLGKQVMRYCPKGVWCKVVDGNTPSMRLFLSAGFQITGYEPGFYVLKN